MQAQQPPATQDSQPAAAPSAPTPAPKKKLPTAAVIAIAAAIGLVVGLAGGLGGMYLYATPIINQQKSDIQDLNTSLDSVKAQLADANEKLNPQEDPNDTGSNTDASGTGETAVSGGVEMKVLEAGEQPTISFDTCGDGCSNGQYGPKTPDANTKYWVAKVEVTNNTSSPMDITCSYPYEIVALNSKNQKYTPIKNLYQVEGNPECNAQLQPGLTSTVTYPFQVPLDAKMVAIAFRDVGDVYSGIGGEDNYSYIVTDPNYVVNR